MWRRTFQGTCECSLTRSVFVGIKYDLGPEKVFTVHSSGVFTQDKSCNFPNSKVYMEKMRPGKSVYYEGVFTMRGFTVLYHNGGGGGALTYFTFFPHFTRIHIHAAYPNLLTLPQVFLCAQYTCKL